MEIDDYPHDFYHRKLSIVVVMRGTDEPPQTLEDYLESINFKASCIGTLAYFLRAIDMHTLKSTDPENLRVHLESMSFLIASFAADIHVEEAKELKERFGLTQ